MYRAARVLCLLLICLAGLPGCAWAQAGIGGVLSRGGPGAGRNVLPGTPNTPAPLDSATGTALNPTLTCLAANAVTYEIKIETLNPPVTTYSLGTSCSFSPAAAGLTLANLTTYFWKICATNPFGTTCGLVWRFTTVAASGPAPSTPNTPSPASGATNIALNPTLTCLAANASTYAIKIDTSNPPVTTYSLGGACSFTPSTFSLTLANSVQYFWSICATGTGTTCGPVWSFTTVPVASTTCTDLTPSPTGRTPIILWTPCVQTTLNQEWADYQAYLTLGTPLTHGGQLMKVQKTMADTNGGGTSDAMTAVMVYQATGDVTYAQIAYTLAYNYLIGHCCVSEDDNNYREMLLRFSIQYDWIYPGLSSTQRTNYVTALKGTLSDAVHVGGGFEWPRLNDSDQQMGFYFGAWALHTVTGGVDSYVESIWTDSRMGGLDATAEDTTSTTRNAIKLFINTMSAGGEYIESSEYNPGTGLIFSLGYKAMLNTLGVEHFPEMATFFPNFLLRFVYIGSPDHLAAYQWGDDENEREFRVGLNWSYPLTQLLAITQGTPNAPYGQDLLLRLVTQYGYGVQVFVQVGASAYALAMGYDPNQTRGDVTTLPSCRTMTGQGFTFCHNGWGLNDSFFGAAVINSQTFVDHQPVPMTTFQLYRKGHWAITHPITYAGVSVLAGHGVNGFSFYDGLFSRTANYNHLLASEATATYAYQSGTTADNMANYGSADLLPTWLHEATRSTLYLPSTDKKSDTIITYDRFYQKRPQDQCNIYVASQCFAFYYPTNAGPGGANFQTIINTKPRRELTFHMDTLPVCASGECTWTTAGSEPGYLTTLLPAAITQTAQQETSALAFCSATSAATANCGTYASFAPPEELKYQVRLTEPSAADFRTFLNVDQVTDGTITRSNTLVESANHNTQGVLVKRQGLNDVLALFNGTRGMLLKQPVGPGTYTQAASNVTYLNCVRLARVGSTVPWVASTATTNGYLFDLDPAGNWNYTLDGGASTPLTVSSAGVALPTFSGIGAHTLVTSVTGAATCTGGYGTEDTGTNSIGIQSANIVETPSSSGYSTTAAITWTQPVSAGSNLYLTAHLWADYTDTSTGCTRGVQTFTKIGGVQGAGGRWIYAYGLANPAVDSTAVTCTFSASTPVVAAGIPYSGVDQTTPINVVSTLSSTVLGVYSAAVIPLRTNTWTVLVSKNESGTSTAGTGTTLRVAGTNGLTVADSNGPVTTSGDTAVLQLGGGSAFGGVTFSLNPVP